MRILAMGMGCIAAILAGPTFPADAQPQRAHGEGPAEWEIEPFSSHYVAEWKDIAVGVSDLELRRDTQPGHYVYKWTTSARGIFRLMYSDDIVQESWFAVTDGQVKPDRYRGREGGASVSFDFDWETGHAFGSSEGKPIDLPLQPGAQDLNSIQIQVMLDLKNGDMPPTFHIIDKDKMKEFLYTREGTAKLRTALGTFDTVIVASRHTADDRRVLRMWFAPALGWVPVQAERTSSGNLEFAMRIKSLNREGTSLTQPADTGN
jgi:Protein of unknown function (DUF3108)